MSAPPPRNLLVEPHRAAFISIYIIGGGPLHRLLSLLLLLRSLVFNKVAGSTRANTHCAAYFLRRSNGINLLLLKPVFVIIIIMIAVTDD